MASKEKLNELYSKYSEVDEITTSQLYECGFNATDLTNLVKEEILERKKRGVYSLCVDGLLEKGKELFENEHVEEAYSYFDKCYEVNPKKTITNLISFSFNLIANRKRDEAILCFEKCHQLDPTNLVVIFSLFVRNILEKNFDKALEWFDILFEANTNVDIDEEQKQYRVDINFYLLLMSDFMQLPEKYIDYVKNLSLEDITIPENDTRFNPLFEHNKIRQLVFNRKHAEAVRVLDEINKKTIHNVVTRAMLYEVRLSVNKKREDNCILLRKKQYDEVKQRIEEERGSYRGLSYENYLTLKLIDAYKKITETQEVPPITPREDDSLKEYINSNDFKAALEKNQEYISKKNHSDNQIKILLDDICKLIEEIEKKQKESIEPVPVVISNVVSEYAVSLKPSYASITIFILENDLDQALSHLHELLKSKGLSQYEFLISDLLKIGLIEHSTAVSLTTLLSILNNNYYFDLYSYIEKFNKAVEKKEIAAARLYLDIISKSEPISGVSIDVNDLIEIYNYISGEKIEPIPIPNSQENIQETPSNSSFETQNTVTYDYNSYENVPKSEIFDTTPPTTNFTKVYLDTELTPEDKKIIAVGCEEVDRSKALTILTLRKPEKLEQYISEINSYPNVFAVKISENKIVIKYQTELWALDKINSLRRKAFDYANAHDYEKALEIDLVIFEHSVVPASMYEYIGKSFIKTPDKRALGAKFLEVYQTLTGHDSYSDLIIMTQTNSKKDTAKFYAERGIKIGESDFKQENYGIENFGEIESFISSSESNFETACREMNLNDEQIMLVKLIFAKGFYAQGDTNMGNMLFESVNRSPNKTPKVVKIMKTIETSRKINVQSLGNGEEIDEDFQSALTKIRSRCGGKKGKQYLNQ